MPRAQLTVTLPEDTWISRVSRANPDAVFRVLAAFSSDDTGVALLELTGPDLVAPLRAMDDADAVVSLDPLKRDDNSVLVQFETDEPLLLTTLQNAGLPLEPPLEVADGDATLEVVAPHDRLSALRDQLDAFGMDFEVGYRYESRDAERQLTPRQRELLVAAVEAGYYHTPRDCTLTELADRVDVAKSTLSETLHRAEETAIKQFASALPEFAGEDVE